MESPEPISRRRFVAGTLAAGGGALLGTAGRSAAAPIMNVADLKKVCRGGIAAPGDPDFEEFVHGGLWNRLIPERGPEAVVRVADEQDVAAAVRFAREHKKKVSIRGGGHNWCQPSLRNGGVLIDLTNLNKILSIDAGARKAVVQPVVSNRELLQALAPHGLAFPAGHCPDVKLSGYLLSGGIAWNQGVWGPGAGSVEAIELVTPAGELITASKDEHADYFWAALGAGCGFFGVVTRYHLKLHPLPGAIFGSAYFYPLSEAAAVAGWLGKIASALSPRVELTMLLLTAPPELAEQAAPDGGKVCLVPATAFADSAEQAKADLKPLDDCPVIGKCLTRAPAAPMSFNDLFAASERSWPFGMRCRVDLAYSESDPGVIIQAVVPHFSAAPSPATLVLLAIPAGPPAFVSGHAYSMGGRCYSGPLSMWKDAGGDAANTAWHEACVALMRSFRTGYYIGESDTVAFPPAAPGSFTAENWKRLADLRAKYDPDEVFFGYFDGLLENSDAG